MSAQSAYLTSIFTSFSTFLAERAVVGSAAHEATLGLAALIENKTDWNNWDVQRLATFWQTTAGAQHASEAQALVTAFVRRYPPTQINVFLHEFCLALKANGCSHSTVKNYRSDISQFSQFADEQEVSELITKPKVLSFLRQQREAGLRHSSIRRKLVSIQQFALWAVTQGLISQPQWFAELFSALETAEPLEVLDAATSSPKPAVSTVTKVSTITSVPVSAAQLSTTIESNTSSPRDHQERTAQLQSSLARLARKHLGNPSLQNGKSAASWALTALVLLVSLIGIGFFGYQQFLLRVSTPFAYPSTPVRPNRQLSFQGRLTDTVQNPITAATDMRFYLFDTGPAIGGGTELWDSGTCSVTPDQDGIFSVGLGDDCGAEITEDVFSENSNVWLEVEIETETLDPRQAIQTVPYALNSETLQGYPITASGAATVNTVVTMNAGGEVVLGEVSPTIRSVSGTFSLEAQTLSLETSSGSNGDIILSPDGTGQVEINADTVIDGYLYAPGATLSATYAGGIPLSVKAGPSATANITEWQNSSGTALTVVDESGNIGIGTSNPARKLVISTGQAQISQTGSSGGLYIGSTQIYEVSPTYLQAPIFAGSTALATGGFIYDGSGSGNRLFFSDDNNQLYVQGAGVNSKFSVRAYASQNGNLFELQNSSGTAQTVFDTNYNLGIGSSAPSEKLDVVGNFKLTGTTTFNSLTYTWPASQTNGYVLSTNGSGTLSWSDPSVLSGGTNLWDTASGALYPKNSTLDLLVGGTATSSAKFALINVNSGNPTATISGNLALAVPTGADPATTLDVYNGGSLNVRTSVGGSAGATSRLFVANSGNIGVGTTNPSVQFEVRRGASTTAPKLYLAADGGNENDYVTELSFVKDTTEISSLYRAANSYGLTLTNRGSITLDANAQGAGTGSDGHIILQPDANVGIGTTSPGGKLQINGGGTGVKSLLVRGNTSDDANIQEWQNSSGTALTVVDESGNIGIGTNAPTEKLHIVAGSQLIDSSGLGSENVLAIYDTLNIFGVDKVGSVYDMNFGNGDFGNGTFFQVFDSTGNIDFRTSTGTINIDNLLAGGAIELNASKILVQTGNLGINTTTPGEKLDIVGNLKLTGTTTFNSLTYTWPASQTNGYVLSTNGSGTLSWSDPSVLSGGTNLWDTASGALYPKNSTLDLLVGGTATTSAKFAFINANSGSPTATISGNLSLQVPTGSAPAATLNILNGGTFNLLSATAGQGDAGLASRLFMTNAGNFGIGSTNPATQLDVSGNITVSDPTGGGGNLYIEESNSVIGRLDASSNILYLISSATSSQLQLRTTNSGGSAVDAMRVDSNGNIGIGDTSPTQLLTVGSGDLFQVNSAGEVVKIDGVAHTVTDSAGDISINSSGGSLLLADADTLVVGGLAGAAYNAFSDSGTTSHSLASDNDLFVEGDFEVDGTSYLDGAATVTGVLSANGTLDLNGTRLILDADADTSLTADTDDQIDIEIAGADDFRFTANTFSALSGSTVDVNSGATLDVNGDLAIADTNISLDGASTTFTQTTGAISFTPAAGTNLNVSLSTTGDFVVNTNDLYVDTSSGNVGIGTTAPSSQLHVYSTAPNLRLESGSANNISIALVNSSYNSSILVRSTGQFDFSNQSNEPIRFSGSGTSWMDMDGNGLTINAQRDLRLADSDSSNYLAFQAPATVSSNLTYTFPGTLTNGYILQTDGSGTLSWADPAILSGGTNLWDTASGALYPKNSTLDLLIGATATTSAKFAFINVNSGTPTATMSAGVNGGLYQSADGTIATTALQTLTLGSSTTGNVSFAPAGAVAATILQNGNFGIGSTNPQQKLDVNAGTSDSVATFRSSDDLARVDVRDNDTAGYFMASNNIFSVGGQNSIHADNLNVSTVDGNVGIGVTAASQKLDVVGQIELSNYLYFGNGASNYLRWDATNFQISNTLLPITDATYSLGSDSNRWQDLYLSGSSLHMGTSGDEGILGYNTASDYFSFDPDADTVAEVVISDTGNLGIGSLTPAAALDVVGDVFISSGLSTFNSAVSDDTIEATTFCTSDGESNCVSDFSILTASSAIWSSGNGAIYPKNSTMDLLLGATATTSAKFAFTNVDSGTPTASISAGIAGGTYLNSLGKLATTAMQNLTLGDTSTTGDVIINPSRNVGIGDTSPTQLFTVGSGDLFQVNSSGEVAKIDGVAHTVTDSGGDISINSNGGSLLLADTDTLVVGGLAGAAYNAFSDSGTAGVAASDDDLYIEDILEVDGSLYVGAGGIQITNILDEDDLVSNSATALATQQSIKAYVDAQVGASTPNFDDVYAQSITDGNLTMEIDNATGLTFNMDTTGVLNIQDEGTTYWSFDDDSTVDVTFPAAGQIAINSATIDSTLTSGVFDLNVDTVTTSNIGLNVDHIIRDSAGITAYGARINQTIDTDLSESSTGYALYVAADNDDASSTITGLYVDADGDGGGTGTAYAAAFMDGFVGIGNAAPSAPLTISSSAGNSSTGALSSFFVSTYTGGSTQNSAIFSVYGADSAPSAYTALAGSASNGSSTTYTMSGLSGVSGSVNYQGTGGTLTNGVGITSNVTNSGAGAMTYGRAYNANLYVTGAGNMVDARGFNLQTITDSGAGSIQTLYGVYLTALTAATSNNYGIWGDAGDWILDEDGGGTAGGTATGGDIILGEGQDLELYHDGTNSYVTNNTGNLNLVTTGNLAIDAATSVSLDGDTSILLLDGGTTYGTITQSGTTDLQIDVVGGNLILASGDTLNIGGVGALGYNAISDSGVTSQTLNSDDDLYIEGDFEVDGSSYFDGAAQFNAALDSNGDVTIADTSITLDGASTTFTQTTGDITLIPAGDDVVVSSARLSQTNSYTTDAGSTTKEVSSAVTYGTTAQTGYTTNFGGSANINIGTNGHENFRAGQNIIGTSDVIGYLAGFRTGAGGLGNYWTTCQNTTCNVTSSYGLAISQLNGVATSNTFNITSSYGIYVATENAFDYGGTMNITNRYGAYLGGVNTSGTSVGTNYGLYIADQALASATNGYGIFGVDGDWILEEDGNGAAGGTSGGGDIMLGAGRDLELYHDGTNSYIMNNTGDLYIGDAATDDIILSSNGGNVGIGDTSPAALLAVGSGDLFQVNSSGIALGPNGSVSAPTFSFTGDPNNGMYLVTTDQLGFTSAGAETLRLAANANAQFNFSNSGTGSINTVLTVAGNSTGTPTAGFGNSLEFYGESSTTNSQLMSRIKSYWSTATHASRQSKLTLSTYNVASENDVLTLDGNGNVGIGTTSPGVTLDVNGDIYTRSGITTFGTAVSDDTIEATQFCVGDGETNCVTDFSGITPSGWVDDGSTVRLSTAADFIAIGAATAHGKVGIDGARVGQALLVLDEEGDQNILTASASGTTVAFLNRSGHMTAARFADYSDSTYYLDPADATTSLLALGNVGIGTTTASQRLHVASGTTDSVATFRSSDDTARIDIQDNDSTTYLGAKDAYGFLGGTNTLSTSNLNIDLSTGNIGLGTTTPLAKMHITGANAAAATGTSPNGSLMVNNGDVYLTAGIDGNAPYAWMQVRNGIAASYYSLMLNPNGGNVGIGTTTASQMLHVNSGTADTVATFRSSDDTARIDLQDNDTTVYALAKDSYLSLGGTSSLATTNLNIHTTTGNTGIGDTSPDALLDFDFASTASSAGTEYGGFFTFSDTGNVSTGTDTGYGLNLSYTRTGASGGTINSYGLNISATGDSGGTSTLTGLNVSVASADTNYAATFSGGNVGIGDSTPDAMLELLSTTEQLRLTHTDGVDETNFTVDTSGNLTIDNSGTKTMFTDDIQVTGNDILDSGAATRLTLGATTTLTNTTTTLSGTATITASSLATLTTSSALSLGGATSLTFTADDATLYGSDSASGDLTLHGTSNGTRTTSYVLIQPTAGNVGIGTTSPAATLDIQGPMVTDGSLSFQSILANDTTAYNSNPVAGQMFYNIYTAGGSFAGMGGISVGKENTTDGNYSSYLALHSRSNGSSVAERLRINSSGNVGIGSTNPAYRLDVATDVTDYAAKIFNDGNSTSRTGLIIQVGSDSGGGTNTAVRFNDGDGTQAGQITFTGTTMTYGSASDVRLKENITVSHRGLADLMQIQVADFNFKIDDSKRRWTGFLAQQLYEHFPDAVAVPNNPEDQWNVDYGKVTPLIVKSIQEQQQIIEQQQAQLAVITQDLGAVSLDSTGQVTLSNQNGNYVATAVSSGSVLTNISAFAQTITANATAGLTTTRELLVQQSAQIANLSTTNITVAGQSLRDFVAGVVRDTVRDENLVSPLAQVELQSDETFSVTNSSGTTIASIDATGTTRLGELVVTGNATVAGTLSSARLTALGELTAGSASISGELIAETVTAATISAESVRLATLEGRMAEFESIKAQTADLVNATVSGTLYANNIDGFGSKVAAAFDEPSLLEILLQKTGQTPAATESATPGNLADLHETISAIGINASSSAELNLSLKDLELTTEDATLTASAAFINDYLKINGSAYINNSLAVRQNLFVGEGMQIADGLIEYTAAPDEAQILAIQPSGKGTLSLLAGLMELNENGQINITGNLAVAGDVKVEGSLLSNLLQPTEYGNPFQVQVAGIATESGQVKESRFEIINELGSPVATISAQGRAAFAGGIGIGSESLGAAGSETDSVTANKTSGKAKIAANFKEVIIKSELLTGNSLIYVTPVGSTENKVLYVKSQTAENKETGDKEGQFVVGFDEAIGQEVEFNWWVVN